MRVLTAAGVVAEVAEGEYASTPIANLLVDASPIRDAVSFMFVLFISTLRPLLPTKTSFLASTTTRLYLSRFLSIYSNLGSPILRT